MSRKHKARRSIPKLLLLWVGKRMLGRVQKRSLRSITERPKTRRWRLPEGLRVGRPASEARKRRLHFSLKGRRSTAPTATPIKPRRRINRRRAGKGIAAALLTTAAVAAIKLGAERVIESEREQHVVTPDFDVFADDDD